MRALRQLKWKSDPELVEVPDPEPGPGEAVIKVGGAGTCHSDLHIMREFEDGLLPWGPPFTLGHENAGWVHKLGPGAGGLEVGQPVAVYGPWGCGTCAKCQVGAENYCERIAPPGKAGGLGGDGGIAEYLLVPAAYNLIPLPEGLDPVTAAPLTDAGLTPYHAVRRSWGKLVPGSTAVVIGAGGLGHLAVQILKATTAARIIAVDLRADCLDMARANGADLTILSDETAPAQIREATGGVGADVVLDFVGNDATLAIGVQSTRMMGDLTVVGLGGGAWPVSFFSIPFEVSLQTTYWGTRSELVEVLDLASRGLLRPQVTTYPLDQAVEAYHTLEAGKVNGRAVIVPN